MEINLNSTSWIKYTNQIPNELKLDLTAFNLLWDIHPSEKGHVKIFDKLIETPRWQQSYGQLYNFSGTTNKALETPDIINNYIKWANSNDISEGLFNMSLVNWYSDGKHYIGPHSDDTRQLVKNSPIYCFSFGEERDFIMIDKLDSKKQRYALK
jgi:alkylated DNA repair dioxygenase AlkB